MEARNCLAVQALAERELAQAVEAQAACGRRRDEARAQEQGEGARGGAGRAAARKKEETEQRRLDKAVLECRVVAQQAQRARAQACDVQARRGRRRDAARQRRDDCAAELSESRAGRQELDGACAKALERRRVELLAQQRSVAEQLRDLAAG